MTTELRTEILDHLKAEHGLARVTMAWVRNRYNPSWDKLSRPRADAIAAWFRSQGLLHQPAQLPSRETEYVTIYALSSNIGVVIAAARGEGPFDGLPEAAQLTLKNYAALLAKQEADSAIDDVAVT